MRHRAWANRTLVMAFAVLVCVPAVRHVLAPTVGTVASEFRTRAPLPTLRLKSDSLRGFPARFESYFNDCFGFRDALIRLLCALRVEMLGVSTSPKVTVGADGWFFSAEPLTGPDRQLVRPFTTDELVRWQRLLENRRDWLARRGIAFVFVVAPDKQAIYPEYLPRSLREQQALRSRLDQLAAHLRANSDVVFIDLRGPLFEAKARERLFDRTDTHWNDRGAYVAYRAILEGTSSVIPGLHPQPRTEFEETREWDIGGDLVRMLDIADWYREEHLGLKRKSAAKAISTETGQPLQSGPSPLATECLDVTWPRAVVLCDSFAIRLAPFLSEHFHRVVFHWQMVFPTFETAIVERERPNIVIQEMVERKLAFAPPFVDEADPLCGFAETWQAGLRPNRN
jgi:hypothetical protein